MMDEAQLTYFQEVLGARWIDFAPSASAPVPLAKLVVITGAIGEEERALLTKILASIHLSEATIVEAASHLTDTTAAVQIAFLGAKPFGQLSPGSQWQLPQLKDMLGAGPEVASLKRLTWNCLQELARELS